MTTSHSDHTSNSAFYDPISKAYDLIADASEHIYRQHGIAALGLRPGDQVLEIGFGTGNGLIELAETVGPTGHITGLDISTGMRDVALAKIQNTKLKNQIHLIIGSALSMPFEAQSFDAVFMSFTLELFEDDEIPLVLSAIQQVIKPSGKLCVVALASPPKGEKASMMTRGYQWFHRHFPHIADCKPIDVTAHLAASGFRISTDNRENMWGMEVAITVGQKSA